MESIICKRRECYVCGGRGDELHHCIHGSNRKLADDDGLTVWLCRECHHRLHSLGEYDNDLKKIAQAAWEAGKEEARHAFIRRYGRNYL